MKNIIVLVDFSATADNALDQAIAVSDSESSITVCHVKGLSSEESHESEMADYLNKVTHAGLKGNALILEGSFLAEVSSYVEKNRPDLRHFQSRF